MKKILLITSLISFEVFAQSNTVGYMYGSVSTTSGDGVSNCNVTIKNEDVGTKRTANLNADGSFRVSALTVGKYTVTADCDGYNSAALEHLRVNVGSGTNAAMLVQPMGSDTEKLDSMTVVGGRISAIDISSTESTTIFTEETYDRLPVARNLTSIALLAPGTTGGDNAFGNLASFGGSSVAENAYFINGMDVTNFRNGLGGSTVPFEFYQEFQVKTGGYGVEFGRSTGGVVNAVTKSGTNEWKFGTGAYYSPNTFRKSNYDIFRRDGSLESANIHDSSDSLSVYVEAGGPIIEDKLFFYALYNPRDVSRGNVVSRGRTFFDSNTDDAFYGFKLDWFINDNHKVEYTTFSDKSTYVTEQYSYNHDSHIRGTTLQGITDSKSGGENHILKYTGYLTPDLTISATVGTNKYDRTVNSTKDTNPVIYDNRRTDPTDPDSTLGYQSLGDWVNFLVDTSYDKREQFRFDVDYALNDNHSLKGGIDYQTNTSYSLTSLSGSVYWLYQSWDAGDTIPANGAVLPDGVTETARKRTYGVGGSFDTISNAIYLEDTWTVTDDLTLTLGLRNESFDNKNSNGDSFIKISNQLAPRMGVVWDVNGEGNSKVFSTLGRYYLPIASNTNVRLSGAETYIHQYYALNGLNADDTPNIGAQIGSDVVYGDGQIPDADSIRDSSIKPMYQDEFILGYEREIFDGVRAGVRYIYRDLGSTIEDVAIDAALNSYAAANGFDDFHAGGFDYYVLTNPGTDMDIKVDMDGDGTLDQVHLTKDELGYPDSKRSYKAVELFFEKVWDGVFTVQGSYTYSSSRGNNEGSVRSDNGQDDAGLTTLFDQPGLLDGAYGPLPNDRPHTVKIFGTWEFMNNWQLSFNTLMTSGRPINAFGVHPTDAFAAAYGAASFYNDGNLVPRGSLGRTAFRTQLDLALQYTHDFGWRDSVGSFRVDLFNVFDAHNVTEVQERAETDGGQPNPSFLLPTGFQQPQYVRFSANFKF